MLFRASIEIEFDYKKFCFRLLGSKKKLYIFTKKEVNALVQTINFISTNIQFPGLFRIIDNRQNVQIILKKFKHGDPFLFRYLYDNCTPIDCTNALSQYLLQHKPLMPQRIQSLICASNDGVTIKTVALDALGLLYDEFKNCNNFILIYKLLDLMKILMTRGSQRPTEMRICHAPFILVPMFFEETREILLNYKKICDVIHEMILLSGLLRSSSELSKAILQNRLSYDIQRTCEMNLHRKPKALNKKNFHRRLSSIELLIL
uniref:CSON009173 protein n=1 Tax=Culicoides sonorensis TaxID=179676 RepID=A0A336MHH8_CULSO